MNHQHTVDLSYGPFISRKQAQEQGIKHYFTGKPCKNGHVSTRGIKKWNCLQCDREQKAAERVRDPERVRANERRTASNHRAKKLATIHAWRKRNPDKIKDYGIKRRNDPDKQILYKQYISLYWKNQRAENTVRALEKRLRSRINGALRRADVIKTTSATERLARPRARTRPSSYWHEL